MPRVSTKWLNVTRHALHNCMLRFHYSVNQNKGPHNIHCFNNGTKYKFAALHYTAKCNTAAKCNNKCSKIKLIVTFY